MIYTSEPEGFNKKFDIVMCFCEREGTLLLLHRQDHKAQGNQWGFPAGKVNPEETPLEAIQRELQEETGLSVAKNQFTFLQTVYDRYPEYDFLFHMFKALIPPDQTVTINSAEHKAFLWATPQEILKLNFMEDLDTVMRLYYSAS